MSIVIIYMIR